MARDGEPLAHVHASANVLTPGGRVPLVSHRTPTQHQDRLVSVWSHRYNELMSKYDGTLPPQWSQIDDFNHWIQSGDYREMGLVMMTQNPLPHECSNKSSTFMYLSLIHI